MLIRPLLRKNTEVFMHPQEILYLDMTDSENACTSIYAKDIKLIPTGTTVYAMPVSDKNPEYDLLATDYDIHFILDDDIPEVSFYGSSGDLG